MRLRAQVRRLLRSTRHFSPDRRWLSPGSDAEPAAGPQTASQLVICVRQSAGRAAHGIYCGGGENRYKWPLSANFLPADDQPEMMKVMDAVIAIKGADEVGELAALAGWLRAERELQGAVQLVRKDIAEGELGSGLDVVSVAVGSGGVGVALAQSLVAWLRTRRSDVKVTVTANGRTVEVDARRVSDPTALITRVLDSNDDAGN